MSLTATEITDIDLSHWVPGTRMFSTSDGKYFVVDSDFNDYPTEGVTFVRRETVIHFCTEQATVTSLAGDHTFPPGTTAEAAIAAIGYTLTTS